MTVAQIIDIGKVSSYLASVDVANGALYGARVNPTLPLLISMETDVLEWQSIFNPGDLTLYADANYLYSLCSAYNLEANAIINGGGGGLIPPSGGAGVTTIFPIVVNGGDFESDGITYNNANMVGYNLMIFIGGYNQEWHFAPTDFVYTSTGIQIVIPGFNANNFDYITIQNYIIN